MGQGSENKRMWNNLSAYGTSVTYPFLPRLRDNFGEEHGKSIRAKDGKTVDE